MSSLPKQYNPVLSSSPSRHSPFRAGTESAAAATAAATSAAASLRIDHPHHAGRTPPGAHETHDDHNDEHDYEEDNEHLTRPDPDFKPFFTLIEDENFGDYHHPTVHYVFSDDDPDLITEAALRALETDGNGPYSPGQNMPSSAGDGDERRAGEEAEVDRDLHKPSSYLPPPLPGVKERFIILDVERQISNCNSNNNNQTQGVGGAAGGLPSSAPDTQPQFATSAGTAVSSSPAQRQQSQQTSHGYRIVSAHSLTPDWQVLNTSLGLAPTFDTPQTTTNDADADSNAPNSNALMLRIQGTSGFPRDVTHTPSGGGGGKEREAKSQTLEEMMEQFEKRMAELRRVIEAGGGERRGGVEDRREGSDDATTKNNPPDAAWTHDAQPTGDAEAEQGST